MSDLEDALAALNRARVRYLLVGGLASILHGVPRTTTDVDIAVDPKPENVGRALRALRRIGLVPDTDEVADVLGQGGVTATNRLFVDILTSLPAGTFADLWRRRRIFRFRGARSAAVSKSDQIRLPAPAVGGKTSRMRSTSNQSTELADTHAWDLVVRGKGAEVFAFPGKLHPARPLGPRG